MSRPFFRRNVCAVQMQRAVLIATLLLTGLEAALYADGRKPLAAAPLAGSGVDWIHSVGGMGGVEAVCVRASADRQEQMTFTGDDTAPFLDSLLAVPAAVPASAPLAMARLAINLDACLASGQLRHARLVLGRMACLVPQDAHLGVPLRWVGALDGWA
eukprot:356973-Chlamydomonas_euryale.AAC.2